MILIKSCVRFKCIPEEFFDVWEALREAGKAQNRNVTITGAAYEKYEKGSYHDQGYAWDVRISNIPDRLAFVFFIYDRLIKIDERYRIVYGNADHIDHIHIEYQYDRTEKKKIEVK